MKYVKQGLNLFFTLYNKEIMFKHYKAELRIYHIYKV